MAVAIQSGSGGDSQASRRRTEIGDDPLPFHSTKEGGSRAFVPERAVGSIPAANNGHMMPFAAADCHELSESRVACPRL
jgi:hypothetical protein